MTEIDSITLEILREKIDNIFESIFRNGNTFKNQKKAIKSNVKKIKKIEKTAIIKNS